MTHFNQDTKTTMIRFTRHIVMVLTLIASAASSAHVHTHDAFDKDELEAGELKRVHATSTQALTHYSPATIFFGMDNEDKTSNPTTAPLNFNFTVEVAEEGQSAFQKVSQAVGNFFAKF